MKRKIFILTACTLLLSLLFVGCSVDFGGEPVHLTYHEEEIKANLQNIADQNGLYIKLNLVEEAKEGEDTDPSKTYDLIYGATADAVYYMDKDAEYYFDLSNEDCYVVYTKNVGDEEWTKEVKVYDDTITKATAKKEIEDTINGLFTCLTCHLEFEGQNMKKSEGTVLGRNCDKYSFSMKMFGIKMAYNTLVDVETGACLSIQFDVNAFKEAENVAVFSCTEFKTNYTIVLPTVEE